MKQIQAYLLAFCCSTLLLPVYASELSASVQWDQRLVMGTLVPGVVSKVPVKAGQTVRKGDLLLALDNRALQAAVNQAKAQAKYAQLLLAEAQRSDERTQELYDRTLLSEHERTQSTVALGKAQAEHAKAKAALAQAYQNLRQSQLHAPFNAVVLQVNAQPGQVVSSALKVPELVVLAKQGSMQAQLNTDLATAQAIAQAAQVDVVIAGQRYRASHVQVGMEVAAQSTITGDALYQVTASFQPAVTLRAGQAATLVW